MKELKTLLMCTELMRINLKHFDNTQTTGSSDLTAEMKTFYSKYLITLAEPLLVHDQWAQKHPIPQHGGKTIEFRKYDSLAKALDPLVEGVTPHGNKLVVSTITSTVNQFGDYIELSDVLLLTAIDNNLVQATELLASQAGRTLDTITREILVGGTSVQIGDGTKNTRAALVGGESSGNDYLTVDCIRKAVRSLKVMNTPRIDGGYVGIIHPSSSFDLMSDPAWQAPHQYVDTENLYAEEIGRVAGVRFSETTEAKIFHAENLLSKEVRTLTVASYNSGTKTVTIDEALTSAQATALVGRKVIIDGEVSEITEAASGSAGSATFTVKDARTEAPADNDVVYPGEAGAKGRDVYATLVMGANAYGVTEVSGGGLQHIVKQLGSAGTADPLNQRATAGWKAIKTAERLIEQYMVRIETCSRFQDGAN